jgi:peptidylprolyl isomerase
MDARGRAVVQNGRLQLTGEQGATGTGTLFDKDGLSVNRVQDNYVVQWGDPDAEDPNKARALPRALAVPDENAYLTPRRRLTPAALGGTALERDSYAASTGFTATGWPYASDGESAWPVHCYGMVGVGRGLSPDTGSGAELYAVIGHAPRHLDRNIALVGRTIDGIEHLSSLPRGTGQLGFYETAGERVQIVSIRLSSEMEVDPVPAFEFLSTTSETFARYAAARANRRDDFFIQPAGGADICNIPVPVRRAN